MAALIWLGLASLAIALLLYYPRWRLARVKAAATPAAHIAIFERNIAAYGRMDSALQHQLQALVRQFLHQKKFIGCEGLSITEEMRVTIAGQACMLLLNRPSKVYPVLRTVLLYPTAFLVPRAETDASGVVTMVERGLLGESWGDGRVVLAWDHVRRAGRMATDSHNVVLHEFAHQLDSESGSSNGAPFLGDHDSYRRWAAVLSRDFAGLRRDAIHAQRSVLDHYGASSPAEFFAVATETFFEKPYQMAERHAELFDEFQKYYRVDPRAWSSPPPEPLIEEAEMQSYFW